MTCLISRRRQLLSTFGPYYLLACLVDLLFLYLNALNMYMCDQVVQNVLR